MQKRRLIDATRTTIQSVMAAMASYSVLSATFHDQKFVGIISAVLVVQPQVSSALREAKDRLLATLVGCIIAISGIILLPGEFGTIAALGISIFAVSAVAGFRPEWSYGIVAAIALSLAPQDDLWQTAIDRIFAIGIGMFIGLLMTSIVWPDTAGSRARSHLRSALRATSRRLNTVVRNSSTTQKRDSSKDQREYHANINSARDSAEAIIFGSSDNLLERIDLTRELYNSVLILDRVAQETNDVHGNNDKFGETIEDMRQTACEIVEVLSQGHTDVESEIDEYNTNLNRLREIAANEQRNPREHVIQNALVFGLGEVSDSLAGLAENIRSAN